MGKYLFVPACEVLEKDSLMGTMTAQRLSAGLSEWLRSDYDRIIVTGGIYLPPNIQTIPAGELMRGWLIDNGIDSENIICERWSLDTYQNIDFSMKLIAGDSNPQITIVSQWQHAMRFKITFWRLYNIKVNIVSVVYKMSLKAFLLECCYILYHLLDKKGTLFFAKKNRENRTFS